MSEMLQFTVAIALVALIGQEPGRLALVLCLRRKSSSAWADLPVELLQIISGGLTFARDVICFRSVCRSWRSSTDAPPNLLSAVCPFKGPINGVELYLSGDFEIKASALCLLTRPKTWLVALEETSPGEIEPLHALNYGRMELVSSAAADLYPPWRTAIQKSVFHLHTLPCPTCKGEDGVRFALPIVLTSSSLIPNCFEGLFAYPEWHLYAFRLDLDMGFRAKLIGQGLQMKDYVQFRGEIYALEASGHVYMLDKKNLKLIELVERSEPPKPFRFTIPGLNKLKFVVSGEELFVVRCYYEDGSACEVYKIQVGTEGIWRQPIDDLGERVFFITQKCSISILASILPDPWEKNCIVLAAYPWSTCSCSQPIDPTLYYRIFNLTTKTVIKLWSPEGQTYAQLFTPSSSLVVEEIVNPIAKEDSPK